MRMVAALLHLISAVFTAQSTSALAAQRSPAGAPRGGEPVAAGRSSGPAPPTPANNADTAQPEGQPQRANHVVWGVLDEDGKQYWLREAAGRAVFEEFLNSDAELLFLGFAADGSGSGTFRVAADVSVGGYSLQAGQELEFIDRERRSVSRIEDILVSSLVKHEVCFLDPFASNEGALIL